jgi:hypothetical protein
VSTLTSPHSLTENISLHADLHAFLTSVKADFSLLLPNQIRRRLAALDEMDARFGGHCWDDCANDSPSGIEGRARDLARRFEAANERLYRSVRHRVVHGGNPAAVLEWLESTTSEGIEAGSVPGLGFDYLDELVSGVLQFHEPADPNLQLSPEMVPYQPTPARHILKLIETAVITDDDVFVDLGSGLGHVPLLVSMATGAESIGIELQASHVKSARECVQSLQLDRVRFIAQDARDADLSQGNVFYLFSPFRGSILDEVLTVLENESRYRPLKVCSLGPCTRSIAKENWLTSSQPTDTEVITVFESL